LTLIEADTRIIEFKAEPKDILDDEDEELLDLQGVPGSAM
jgi:hypothetical protein